MTLARTIKPESVGGTESDRRSAQQDSPGSNQSRTHGRASVVIPANEELQEEERGATGTWGHEFKKIDSDVFRIGFANPQGLSVEGCPGDNRCNRCKDCFLRKELQRGQFSVFGFNEVNVAWKNIPEKDNLYQRTSTWFQTRPKINSAYYKEYKRQGCDHDATKRQMGGVSLWSIEQGVNRHMNQGADHLGRWAWSQYRGSNGKTLRVITAYRLHENKVDPGSVWAQQDTYFRSVG